MQTDSVNNSSSTCSGSQNVQMPPATPEDLGDFKVFPTQLMVHILSQLTDPFQVVPVSRRMKFLANEALKVKLLDDGVCISRLAQLCGLDSINPLCMEILLRCGVNLSSIASRSDEETKEELALLLKGKFDLLQSPEELYKYISNQIIENSWRAVRRYNNEMLAPSLFERVARSVNWFWSTPEKPRSSYRKVIQEVQELVNRCKRRAGNIEINLPVDDTISSPTIMPLSFLALPPFEVCQPKFLDLCNPAFIPSGIGSMKGLRRIKCFNSKCTSLPKSVLQLNLLSLEIGKCPNLTRITPSEGGKDYSIGCVAIDRPSKELLENISQIQITELILIDCTGFDQLPSGFENQTSLETMCIQTCSFPLVQWLCRLPLKNLFLPYPSVLEGHLPDSLLDMHTLEQLIIFKDNFGAEERAATDPILQALRTKGVTIVFTSPREINFRLPRIMKQVFELDMLPSGTWLQSVTRFLGL